MFFPHHIRRTPQGAYHYRQAIPKAHRASLGKAELVLSLLTKDPRQARTRAAMVQCWIAWGWSLVDIKKALQSAQQGRKYEIELPNGLKLRADGDDDHRRAREMVADLDRLGMIAQAPTSPGAGGAGATPQPLPTQSQVAGLSLSQALTHYKNSRANGRGKTANQETEKERIKTLDRFHGWHKSYTAYLYPAQWPDDDYPLARIDKTHIAAFRTNEEIKYAPKSLAKTGSYLKAFFDYCQSSGFYPATHVLPTDGQFKFTEQDKRDAEDRGAQAFTDKQLQTIFANLPTSTAHEHLAPLLALFTGARRQDIAGLTLDDFQTWANMPCIHLPGSKTRYADRTIPLHPMLIELGLLEYVEDVKALSFNNPRLFPYLYATKGGSNFGKLISDDFSELLRSLNITHPTGTLGMHSFRDTFNNKLIDNGIEEQTRCQILGQKHNSTNKNHYGKDYLMEHLATFVSKVSFALDLSALRYTKGQHVEFLKRRMKA